MSRTAQRPGTGRPVNSWSCRFQARACTNKRHPFGWGRPDVRDDVATYIMICSLSESCPGITMLHDDAVLLDPSGAGWGDRRCLVLFRFIISSCGNRGRLSIVVNRDRLPIRARPREMMAECKSSGRAPALACKSGTRPPAGAPVGNLQL